MYNIEWPELIRRALPAILRQVTILAYLEALLVPVTSNASGFEFYRTAIARELSITPQVCILRFWLNDQFDPGNGRIRIVNAGDQEPFFIFTEAENRPVYLPRFIAGRAIDFVVLVPGSLRPLEGEIRGFLDKYKLPTKRYRISWI